jgi:membrane protein implicated in regulation of membrane protease activity
MLGLGFRTTSYAFAIAAGFLLLAGQEYHKFAFASLVCALILAYLKINEEVSDRRNDWNNRRIDDISDTVGREVETLHREKADRK